MAGRLRIALGLALSLLALAKGADAAVEQRIALVIGNGGYAELGRLDNPVNDMVLMARTLRGLGFRVIERADADQEIMKRAIKDFGRELEQAGPDAVGLFYYAGHGVQLRGTNYLIPIGAELAREGDVEIEAVNLDWVLAQMEYARNRINVVVLDACRNNPLTRSFRSAERGLSRIDAPRGTLIAYSTAPGSVSADGKGTNSPYTRALAETIQEPELVAESVFRKVRVSVLEATDGRQVPWESSSLTGAFYFKPAAEPAADRAGGPEPPSAAPPDQSAIELAFWKSIEDSDNPAPAAYEDYLQRFPNGVFAGIARLRLDALQRPGAEVEAAATDDAPASRSDAGEEPIVVAAPPAPAATIEPVAPAQTAELPAAPIEAARLAGRWEGRYRCQRDVVGMVLEIEPPADGRIAALFEFFPLDGSPSFPPGSFRAKGVYDPASGRLRLEAGNWVERAWGFQRHDLMGTVLDGRTIDGRILSAGCSEFSVRRLSGPTTTGTGNS